MTSKRFFIEKSDKKGGHVHLTGKEHHHLIHVLRKKKGDTVYLFDLNGNHYQASVETVSGESTKLKIIEKKKESFSGLKISLGQALLKKKNMDLIVQKSTELGVCKLYPLISERSVVKINERSEMKLSRWKKIALEAAKQSGQIHIPLIEKPQKVIEFCKSNHSEFKFFLNEKSNEYLKDILKKEFFSETNKTPSSITLLCGPEGGWTEEEEKYILENQFKAVSLGNQILKSETAALSSVAVFSILWN